MFEIGKIGRLDLGYPGENKARVIEIDMTAWLEDFPGAAVGVMVKRPNESVFYPAALKRDEENGNIIRWTITRADVAIEGEGEAQIILTNEDDVELRSRVVTTRIGASMTGTEVEAPPPESTFVSQVINAAAQAEAAVEKMPSIGENGNWYAWDAEAGAYVDTGIPSRGEQGPQGEKGDIGATGPQGPTGETGPQGIQGVPGVAGEQGPQGVQGVAGADGKDGAAATIKVGTVTTLAPGSQATVSNSGTANAAVLDFGIPRGADGEGGGSSGEAGADGEDGGYYTPSVTDDGILSWAPSKADMPAVEDVNIKGPKGDTGATGATGPTGPQGEKGDKGDTGPQGEKGDIGPQGEKGDKGDTGPSGTDGKDAFTGAYALTVASTAWAGDAAPYIATVACDGVTAESHIIVGVGGTLTADQQAAFAAAMIVCTAQAAGSITLTAFGEVPTIDLPVNVLEVG